MKLIFERRSRFRNKLQYFYSISVFVGVLTTAFLMMERETGARLPIDTLESASSYRLDAGVGDDALARLIEVENALSALKENSTRAKDQTRSIDRLITAPKAHIPAGYHEGRNH